jgi:hypothetical protein
MNFKGPSSLLIYTLRCVQAFITDKYQGIFLTHLENMVREFQGTLILLHYMTLCQSNDITAKHRGVHCFSDSAISVVVNYRNWTIDMIYFLFVITWLLLGECSLFCWFCFSSTFVCMGEKYRNWTIDLSDERHFKVVILSIMQMCVWLDMYVWKLLKTLDNWFFSYSDGLYSTVVILLIMHMCVCVILCVCVKMI